MPSLFLPFSPAIAQVTTGQVDLWVDQTTGNDGNPGTQALPLATIIEAERRIPMGVFDEVFIHVLPGTYVAPPNISFRVMRKNIWVIGEGRTSVLAGTVDAGATTTSIPVTGGGLVANAHRGQFVEIAGQRRLINSNTATNLELDYILGGVPAQGTALEIFLPPLVTIDYGNVVSTLISNSAPSDTGNNQLAPLEGPGSWIYANLRLTASAATSKLNIKGRVIYFGV